VREALRARRRRLKRLLVAEGVQQSGPIVELEALADAAEIEVAYGDRRVLDEITGGVNHQGVALEAGPYPYVELDEMLDLAAARGEPPLLLLLDHLQDPQNVGTLLRTADVVGVHGVVLPGRRSAEVTPAVVNASAGAVEHLRIGNGVNLAQTIEDLKTQGVWVVGLEDDERAQEYDRVDLAMPVALVVGAEGPGLARLVRERCDLLIKLPMGGHVASLNAATAGSIALYYLWRIRSKTS
jgi:23S rRNA (guanosine2251-2'-O)-methyltransferase